MLVFTVSLFNLLMFSLICFSVFLYFWLVLLLFIFSFCKVIKPGISSTLNGVLSHQSSWEIVPCSSHGLSCTQTLRYYNLENRGGKSPRLTNWIQPSKTDDWYPVPVYLFTPITTAGRNSTSVVDPILMRNLDLSDFLIPLKEWLLWI